MIQNSSMNPQSKHFQHSNFHLQLQKNASFMLNNSQQLQQQLQYQQHFKRPMNFDYRNGDNSLYSNLMKNSPMNKMPAHSSPTLPPNSASAYGNMHHQILPPHVSSTPPYQFDHSGNIVVQCICSGKGFGNILQCQSGNACVGTTLYHDRCLNVNPATPWMCNDCTNQLSARHSKQVTPNDKKPAPENTSTS